MPLEEEANSGTLISFEEDTNMEQATITGIAFSRDEAKMSCACLINQELLIRSSAGR
jgi:hypothetical protein